MKAFDENILNVLKQLRFAFNFKLIDIFLTTIV